ncbi:radical SAM protein [bacterium]|nr:radical SAM protein [bacterium]
MLQSLTNEALNLPSFAGIETEVHIFEDSIRAQQRAFRRLLKKFPRENTLLVVGLVGVQSNQFPRALDLCRGALSHDARVVWGGPHITASINASLKGISTIDPLRPGVPSPHTMPAEIQRLLETQGVVVFHGDADANHAWAHVLEDLVKGREKNYYEAGLALEINDPGCIYDTRYLQAFASPVAAVDTERGCPFKCRFCAAIQAHGRKVRSRDPQALVEWVRKQCIAYGKGITVLFASDNLARNPHWRELLSGLKGLQDQGCRFDIWAEADVLCNSGPNEGFLEAYAAAGGKGLFCGIESMNSKNILLANKKQNSVEQLPAFFNDCHRHGIAPEGGYMIGFEHDTPESIRADVSLLLRAGMSRASFFIKALLPGSQDWVEALMAGQSMSPDLNNYDSTIVSYEHEHMSEQEWMHAYNQAVRQFYSMDNMVSTLIAHKDSSARWRLIKGFLWYRWAYLVERSHPMTAGLYRHRPFKERRPDYSRASILSHVLSEVWRHMRYLGLFLREYYIFQNVILETEFRTRSDGMAGRVSRHMQDLTGRVHGVGDWIQRTFQLPMRRVWLNEFWKRYGSRKWKLLTPIGVWWHLKMVPFALSEAVYTLRFTRLFLRGLRH